MVEKLLQSRFEPLAAYSTMLKVLSQVTCMQHAKSRDKSVVFARLERSLQGCIIGEAVPKRVAFVILTIYKRVRKIVSILNGCRKTLSSEKKQ